jgi:hypothetical protein
MVVLFAMSTSEYVDKVINIAYLVELTHHYEVKLGGGFCLVRKVLFGDKVCEAVKRTLLATSRNLG